MFIRSNAKFEVRSSSRSGDMAEIVRGELYALPQRLVKANAKDISTVTLEWHMR